MKHLAKDIEKIKEIMHEKIDDTINNMEKINHLSYFEITLKHVDGEIFSKLSFTDKNRIK